MMPAEPPIACSLSALEQTQRLRDMADIGRASLLAARHDERRADLSFAAGGGMRERVRAIVAAESSCCAFLTMGVSDDADTVVLSIEAPAGAESVLAELVGAFRGQPRAA